MVITAPNYRRIWLSRRDVERMLCGAQLREHCARTARAAQDAHSYVVLLEGFLRGRGDTIEFRGPEHWIDQILAACNDWRAAKEVGRQLQADV